MTGLGLAIIIVVYLMLAVIAVSSGRLVWWYWHVGADYQRRLLPAHVVLVSSGTLILSATSAARVAEFPLRPIYTPLTILGLGLNVAALLMIDRWVWTRDGGTSKRVAR